MSPDTDEPAVLGRYRIVDTLLGYDDVVRAVDSDGRRYLVSRAGHYEHRVPRTRADIARFDRDGFTPFVELAAAPPYDVMVELEPPGRPSYEQPPLAPGHARRVALQLGARLREAGSWPLRPELVYLDDAGHLAPLAPRFAIFVSHHNPTLTGALPSYPVGFLSSEEVRGGPLTRVHDGYVLAAMLRFWLTGAPLVAGHESYMQAVLAVYQRRFDFHYDGPLADVVDAGLGGAELDDVLARLERADTAAADLDHAMRARLIAEVVAHPDDDGPRFVLADYLLERGDPRGDFIQRQLRGEPVDDLLATHGTAWSGHLRDIANEAFFDRGFVAMIRGVDRGLLIRRQTALRAFGPVPRVD